MKPFLLFLLLQFPFLLFSQNSDLSLEIVKIKTQERIFTGSINKKYPITLYLRFFKPSDGHSNIYSVKGYYYYDNVKTHIPVIGIYDGELVLYVFKNSTKAESLLSFQKTEEPFWDKIEHLKNLTDYEEKFILDNNNAANNQWKSGNKTLPLDLGTDDFSISQEEEYLKIKTKKEHYHISFSKLKIYDTDFKVVAKKQTEGEIRILLEFEYISRPYALGMCGAGFESGYLFLRMDKEYLVTEITRELVSSCLEGTSYEDEKSSAENVSILKVVERGGTTYNLLVDKQNVVLKRQ